MNQEARRPVQSSCSSLSQLCREGELLCQRGMVPDCSHGVGGQSAGVRILPRVLGHLLPPRGGGLLRGGRGQILAAALHGSPPPPNHGRGWAHGE